jgi:hypothetical protein
MGRRREGMFEFEFGFVRDVWVRGRRRNRQWGTNDEVSVGKVKKGERWETNKK